MSTESEQIADFVRKVKEEYKDMFEIVCKKSNYQPVFKPMQKGVLISYGTEESFDSETESDSETEDDDSTVELTDNDFEILLERMKEENHKDIKRIEPMILKPKKEAKLN